MLARYRLDRAVTDALLQADPELDVFEATALGYVDRLRARLDEDPAAVAACSADGYTALHFAAFFGKAEAARILLEAGAEVNAVADNEMRVQPLHSAAASRHLEVCRLLLAAGADVNARQVGGFAPLHAAARNGDPGAGRAVPVGPGGSVGRDRCRPDAGRHRRGRRARRTSRGASGRSPPARRARALRAQLRSRYRSRSQSWTTES